MMTQKGRVVYDRKKDLFLPKDIARILAGYAETATGAQFGKFCRGVLELSLKRKPQSAHFQSEFWSYWINFLIPQMRLFDWRDVAEETRARITGGVGVGTKTASPPGSELSPGELKQLKQKGGL